MVRVERVELSFYPWEGYIIAVIRYPPGADKRGRPKDNFIKISFGMPQLGHVHAPASGLA